MDLFLCPNVFNETQKTQTVNCIYILEKQGNRCSLSEADSLLLFGNKSRNLFPPQECELIVSLGGDGAVLRAAQFAVSAGKPLAGINSGRLGFLCVMTFAEAGDFNKIISECFLSERFLLEFVRDGEKHFAVNDVVIAKWSFGASVDLTVGITDFGDYRVRGDGIVISTPTGSTAYNYSAGGPIMDPNCSSVAVTPLCAHHGNTRTIITESFNSISVSERNDSAVIYSDGVNVGELKGTVTVSRSAKKLSLYMRGRFTGVEHNTVFTY